MQWKRNSIILATSSVTHIAALRGTTSASFFHARYSHSYYYPFSTTTTNNNNQVGKNLIILELSSSNQQQQLRNYSESLPINMPRGVKKENLPSKICVTCHRPFTWRKKWERVWDEVTTCSKSCNRKRRMANKQKQQQIVKDDDDDANKNSMDEFLSYNNVDNNVNSDDDGSATIECPQISELKNLKLTESLSADEKDDDDDNNSVHSEDSRMVVEDPNYNANASINNEALIACDDDDPVLLAKKQRRALKKAKKAERRAQREGRGDPTAGQKKCDMCGKSVNLLIRCMYEEGQVDWRMVCGKCWNVASGGVVDGDTDHPHYKYGGLWKNRRAQT